MKEFSKAFQAVPKLPLTPSFIWGSFITASGIWLPKTSARPEVASALEDVRCSVPVFYSLYFVSSIPAVRWQGGDTFGCCWMRCLLALPTAQRTTRSSRHRGDTKPLPLLPGKPPTPGAHGLLPLLESNKPKRDLVSSGIKAPSQ